MASEERRAYQRAYYLANRERLLEYKHSPEHRARQAERARQRRVADPDWRARANERRRQRRAADAELRARLSEKNRDWRAENSDKLKQQARTRYEENGDAIRAKVREYGRRNRLTKNATQRVRQMWTAHRLLPETWAQLLAAQRGCCYLCGRELGERIVVDHDHSHCPAERSCGVCRRGLAHPECNSAIGLIQDDPIKLRKMADALEAAQRQVESRKALMGEQLCLDEGIA